MQVREFKRHPILVFRGRLAAEASIAHCVTGASDYRVGFSGDHSRTIALVQSGAYLVGAVNFKVWENEMKAGRIDPDKHMHPTIGCFEGIARRTRKLSTVIAVTGVFAISAVVPVAAQEKPN